MNSWSIPEWLEKEVIARDKHCVYCGVEMLDNAQKNGPRKDAASWEHIINDETLISRENIARCCIGCNASRGNKKLSEWLNSNYCKKKGISAESVADVIKEALLQGGI